MKYTASDQTTGKPDEQKKMEYAPCAKISLRALRENLQCVRRYAPHSKVMAVIKGNAYGHGLVEIAQALADADGFAVARLSEARKLRAANINKRLLLLNATLTEQTLLECGALNLDLAIHNLQSAELIARSTLSQPLAIWLKLDSGMHRIGYSEAAFKVAHELLSAHPKVKELIHMTHFANADNPEDHYTRVQLQAFQSITSHYDNPVSLANSAAIMAWPETHENWVRPGIMLYGGKPLTGADNRLHDELLPVMTLTSQLIAIHELKEGDAVGYGGTWHCSQDCRIGTVAIGYADGYPRHAKSGTPVLINGQRAPLVGRVSMDLISIDLSHLPDAKLYDTVTLWGEGLPVDEIAQWSDTISYDLLTGVTNRVQFIYED